MSVESFSTGDGQPMNRLDSSQPVPQQAQEADRQQGVPVDDHSYSSTGLSGSPGTLMQFEAGDTVSREQCTFY